MELVKPYFKTVENWKIREIVDIFKNKKILVLLASFEQIFETFHT